MAYAPAPPLNKTARPANTQLSKYGFIKLAGKEQTVYTAWSDRSPHPRQQVYSNM